MPRRNLGIFLVALGVGVTLLAFSGASGLSTPARHLIDQGDGTVLDPNTGLIWLADADLSATAGYRDGITSRAAALHLIGALNTGWLANYGFTDWRLPTAGELERLTAAHGIEPTQPKLFRNVRRAYWTESGLGSSDLSFAFPHSDREALRRSGKPGTRDPSPAVWPVRAGVVASEFRRLSIFASNSIWLQKGSQLLSGNALVNEVSPGPTLNSEVEFSVARDVVTHPSPTDQGMLKADSFAIGFGAVIGSDSQDTIAYNELRNHGTLLATQIPSLSLPVIPPESLPPFHGAVPGLDDVVVAKNATVAIPPGSYRDILVGNGGIVLFESSSTGSAVFDARAISGGNNVQLRFEGRTEVRVADKLNVGKGSYVGPDTAAAAARDIVFYVAGINGSSGDLDASPESVQIGQSSLVHGNFFAPNGTIFVQMATDATGGLFGRDVRIGVGAQVSSDNFLSNEPPTDILLSNDMVNENSPIGTVIGTLSAVDPDLGDTFTFTEIADPDDKFSVMGSDLIVDGVLDFETKTSHNVTIRVTDSGGLTFDKMFVITVENVNEAPTANAQMVMADEDVAVMFTLTGSDPDGDMLVFTVVPASGPSHGTLGGAPPNLTYTPDTDFNGTDSFDFDVQDPGGLTDTATVDITVNAVNDPPVAGDVGPISVHTHIRRSILDGAEDLLSNSSDVDLGSTLSVNSVDATSANGGAVVLTNAALGEFSYNPPAGFTGMDTFGITVCDDGQDNGNALTPLCDTATVTINVAGPKIWFVDATAAGGGTGRLTDPFNQLAGGGGTSFDANASDGPNDIIFVDNKGGADSYLAGLTLLGGQQLIGKGITGADFDSELGITPPAGSDARPSINGARPILTATTNAVSLGTNNTVRGLNFGDRSGFALFGSNYGTLTVNTVAVVDSGAVGGSGGGVSLNNGVLAVTLDSLNSSSSSSFGVFLGNSSGSFTVTGLTSVSSSATNAINLQNLTGATTFGGGINITVNGATGFFAGAAGTVNVPSGTITSTNGGAINVFGGTLLNASLGAVSATTVGQNGVRLDGIPGSAVSLSGVTVVSTGGGAGLIANNSGTLNVTGSTNTVATNSGTAVRITGTTIGSGNATFRSVNSTGAGANSAIVLANTGMGDFTVTGDGSVAGSGGTIANKTVDAITLDNTGGMTSLKYMIVQDITAGTDGTDALQTRSGRDAIHGQSVGGGLTVDHTTIRRVSDNAINGALFSDGVGATTWNGLHILSSHLEFSNRFATNPNVGDDVDEALVRINGITGSVTVMDSTFNDGAGALDLITESGPGTLDMTVQGSSFTDLYKEFGCLGVVPTVNVGRRGISVQVEGSHDAVVRIGDPAESNHALGNTFTNNLTASVAVIGQEGGGTPHTGDIDTVISQNDFVVTDHLTGSAGCPGGSLAFNFPAGGVSLNPSGGTFEGIVSHNLFDQVFHAAGGLGQLTLGINTGGGHSEFIVTANEFRLPWDAAVQIRSENGLGGSSAVLFDGNTYTDGMVGGPSDDVGFSTQSPFQGMLVNVRGDSHLDLTVQNEDLPTHDTANSPTPQTMQVEVQNQVGNVLNLFVQDTTAPYGYGFTQSNGAFNLYRLNPGDATATAIMTSNGNTGGGGNRNLSPPTVVMSGTITPSDTPPTLPVISIP